MEDRNSGEMGESIFSSWCAASGITANKSLIDKTGWDFTIEFPFNEDTTLPRDMWSAPLECKVQVKATDLRKRKLQLTTSNLHRLIKTQMPSFICVMEFDHKNDVQRAFLIHIGKELIEKTLKRIRELAENAKGDKLNKHKILIHYDKTNQLLKADGESLKKCIKSFVPSGFESYIVSKNKLLKTLGFENGSAEIKFTMTGEEKIKSFIDMTLGIKGKVEVDRFAGHHSRFGIISDKPFIESKKGAISIQDIKPFSKVKVSFKEYDFSAGISFDAASGGVKMHQNRRDKNVWVF